jgi:hypothetical protein
VRVYETGQDCAAGSVQRRLLRVSQAQFFGWPDGYDILGADEHRTVFHDAQVSEGVSALRAAGQGKELGGGMDQHGKDILL